eukprot:5286077-Amphidinium_carterae.1
MCTQCTHVLFIRAQAGYEHLGCQRHTHVHTPLHSFSSSVAIPYLSLPPVGVHGVESAELLHEPVGVPYMFAVADSAHANVGEEKVSSQAGYVIGVRTGNHFHPLDVTSFKIKRVCRSTLAAECNALCEASEALHYAHSVLSLFVVVRSVMVNHQESCHCVGTDAKSLHDVVRREGSSVADKRLRILVAQLREMRSDSSVQFISLGWTQP